MQDTISGTRAEQTWPTWVRDESVVSHERSPAESLQFGQETSRMTAFYGIMG